jgi:hypothetical protein
VGNPADPHQASGRSCEDGPDGCQGDVLHWRNGRVQCEAHHAKTVAEEKAAGTYVKQVGKPSPKATNSNATGCLAIAALIVMVALAVWIFGSGNGGSGGNYIPLVTSPPRLVTVVYKVGGTASRASLTIENESGGTEQFTVSIPWTKSFQVSPGSFVYVSAQNEGDHGSVTCTITSNGVIVQSANSTGAYVIAGCSGSA